MADISYTTTNVVPGADAVLEVVTAGGTLTSGMPVYRDATAANKVKACQADTLAKSTCYGIVLSAVAALNQPVVIARSGSVTFGSGLTVGTTYCVSDANAGGIAPEADLTTGDYKTILGVATSTSVLKLQILNSGVAES